VEEKKHREQTRKIKHWGRTNIVNCKNRDKSIDGKIIQEDEDDHRLQKGRWPEIFKLWFFI
jgi:hypothetical protein